MFTLTWEIIIYAFSILLVVTGWDAYNSSRIADKNTKHGLVRCLISYILNNILLIWMLLKDVM